MTAGEIAAIVIGLAGGYGVVSVLAKRRTPPAANSSSEEAAADSSHQEDPAAQMFPDDWAITLRVSSESSVDDIRRAYKSLLGQYHPDKVATLGAELRELADFKAKQITAAYREAMRQKGASP